jgi:hypothetical protein
LPRVEADLKTSRPKIKLICERETPVENVTKGIFDMMLSESKGQQ